MTAKQKAINCPNGVTAMGTVPRKNHTIACNASMLGKWVNIVGVGNRLCEDRGGAINGLRIDEYVGGEVGDHAKAMAYGKRTVEVQIIN